MSSKNKYDSYTPRQNTYWGDYHRLQEQDRRKAEYQQMMEGVKDHSVTHPYTREEQLERENRKLRARVAELEESLASAKAHINQLTLQVQTWKPLSDAVRMLEDMANGTGAETGYPGLYCVVEEDGSISWVVRRGLLATEFYEGKTPLEAVSAAHKDDDGV